MRKVRSCRTLAYHAGGLGTSLVAGEAWGDLFLVLQHEDCVALLARMATFTKLWQCRLTDFEWDVKQPLKTRSSMAASDRSQCPISLEPQWK